VAEDPAAWFKEHYLAEEALGLSEDDLVDNSHCMHPAFIKDQIQRSLENLGLDCIDIYYLHNPEQQLLRSDKESFYDKLLAAFQALEEAAAKGLIGCYGVASWRAFRVGMQEPGHMSLARMKNLADQAAGSEETRLRVVQLPFNLAMPEALLASQPYGGDLFPTLELARQLDLSVVASAALCQGQLVGKVPKALAKTLGKDLTSAQQCLQFTRSTPGVTTALVGMKTQAHVDEDLALTGIEPLSAEQYLKALGQG
jgi:aryl-alcohol dehydrogenase-like predicted oxidoreductase